MKRRSRVEMTMGTWELLADSMGYRASHSDAPTLFAMISAPEMLGTILGDEYTVRCKGFDDDKELLHLDVVGPRRLKRVLRFERMGNGEMRLKERT